MTDRTFILIIIEIKKIAIKILIRGLEFKIYYSNEYVIFLFYIKGVLFDDTRIFAQITRKIYIVNNFKIEIFISADILILK